MGNIELTLLIITLMAGSNAAELCPSVCSCKWKGGKQTVECLAKALITIPENVDFETQVLDMSGNNLQIIPRETFYKANLTNLQKIYLRSCRIGQIGEHSFRGLTNLVELDLSQNLLTSVPSAAFEDTPFLRYLSLAGNPIQKIESNAFRMILGVSKIDLSNCGIQSISANTFDKLESLEWLKLNGNKLSEIHPRTVDALGKLHGVDLHDNPWLCDCKLRSLKEWIMHNSLAYPIVPTCRKPDRISGRTFEDLTLEDFACKPEVLPMNRYVEATTGENATVFCRVGAVPAANIHWYWNGRLLLNNSAFSAFQKVLIFEEGNFEKTSSLVLTNVFENDSGEFYCVAENKAGTAEANFTINVSLRSPGMSSLGSGQIAGLTVALVALILAVFAIVVTLLIRLRRVRFSQGKIQNGLEVIESANKSGAVGFTKNAQGVTTRTSSEVCRSANPIQKSSRGSNNSAGFEGFDLNGGLMTVPGNNPDVIRDVNPIGFVSASSSCSISTSVKPCDEFPRSAPCDFFYPYTTSEYRLTPSDHYAERDGKPHSKTHYLPSEGIVNRSFTMADPCKYPADYGLPIPNEDDEGLRPRLFDSCRGDSHYSGVSAFRMWQNNIGGVPTPPMPPLPAANARTRAHTASTVPPDEPGYREGCGTDV